MAIADTGMNNLLASERWSRNSLRPKETWLALINYDVIKNQPAHWREAIRRQPDRSQGKI